MKLKFGHIVPLGLRTAILLVMVLTMVTSAAAEVSRLEPEGVTNPTTVLYQGYVTVSDVAYQGTGYFKFAIVNAAGSLTYWSNDGSSSGGGAPLNAVTLTVKRGYFTVLLGDTSLTGMTQTLEPGVFSSPGRYLRVWFAGSAGGPYTQLSLVPIAATPYALNAETLDGIDGAALQLRVTSSCAAGSAIRVIDASGAVSCEIDDNTSYSAGTGLSLSGTTFSADSTYLQRRVTGTCAAGNAIRVVNSDGTVSCEADDNTTYSAGVGLSLSGTTFAADSTYLQRRVTATCPAGNAIRVINADGTVSCQAAGSAAHTHWGETWSGTNPGLVLNGSSITAATLQAINSSTATSIGIVGETATTDSCVRSYGVKGLQGGGGSNPFCDTVAIMGDGASRGVLGAGSIFGTAGISLEPSGWGLFGRADGAGGRGVNGWALAEDGTGVYGEASSASTNSANYGVKGLASSNVSMTAGVSGRASSTAGNLTIGVYGRSDSGGGCRSSCT